KLRGPRSPTKDVCNAIAPEYLLGDARHVRARTCFHSRSIRSQYNVWIKNAEQGGEIATLRCSEKGANNFALAYPVGFRRRRRALDSPPRAARELSRRHRRAANDQRNLIERDVEHVMQYEHDPLRRCERLEH